MDFREFIEIDREQVNIRKFEGNFLDYLEIVKENLEVVIFVYKRIYDMIMSRGVEVLKGEDNLRVRKIYGNDVIKKYGFFKDDFYGIDKVIMKLVSYFKLVVMKGEEFRQVLYFVGLVGVGKFFIVESLKLVLEYCELVYGLKGCLMYEQLFYFILKYLRLKFEEMFGVKIEGDLCLVCKYKLIYEFKGRYEEFLVERVGFLIRFRKGIGVVLFVDFNN